MALAYRTSTQGALSTSNPVTLSVTISTGDALLVVGIVGATTAARGGGAPTRGSQTFTQVGTAQAGSAECNAELWYVNLPTVGTANVSVPNSGALSLRVMAHIFTGAGASLFNSAQTGTSVDDPTLTINSVPSGAAVIDVFGSGHKDASTASDTGIYANDEGAYCTHAQYAIRGTLGNETFTWTTVGEDDVAFIMAAFQESTAQTYNETATLTGAASISGSGPLDMAPSVTLTGAAVLSDSNLADYADTLTLAGNAAVTPAGTMIAEAILSLSAAGLLSTSGAPAGAVIYTVLRALGLPGPPQTFTAKYPAAGATYDESLTIAADAAAALVASLGITSTLGLAADASIDEIASLIMDAIATLEAQGAIAEGGLGDLAASAQLTADGTLTPAAVADILASVNLTGAAILSPGGTFVASLALALAAAATLEAGGEVVSAGVYNETLGLVAIGGLTPAAILEAFGTASLEGSASITPDAVLSILSALTLNGDSSITVSANWQGAVTAALEALASLDASYEAGFSEFIALAAAAAIANSYALIIERTLGLAADAVLTPGQIADLGASIALQVAADIQVTANLVFQGLLNLGAQADSAVSASNAVSTVLTLGVSAVLSATGVVGGVIGEIIRSVARQYSKNRFAEAHWIDSVRQHSAGKKATVH